MFLPVLLGFAAREYRSRSMRTPEIQTNLDSNQIFFIAFNGSQLAKMKKSIPDMSLP